MSIDLLLMPLLLPLDTFDMFIKHLLNICIVDLKYLSNRGTPRRTFLFKFIIETVLGVLLGLSRFAGILK